MIVSPSSSHSFRILVVRNDIVVVGELFVADGAYSGVLVQPEMEKRRSPLV
jgi:hypothetical protein